MAKDFHECAKASGLPIQRGGNICDEAQTSGFHRRNVCTILGSIDNEGSCLAACLLIHRESDNRGVGEVRTKNTPCSHNQQPSQSS
jgi:hypothetical protein